MEDLFEQMMGSRLKQTQLRRRSERNNFDDLKGTALREAMGASFNSGNDDFDSSTFLDMDHELLTEPLGGEIEIGSPITLVDLREEEDL